MQNKLLVTTPFLVLGIFFLFFYYWCTLHFVSTFCLDAVHAQLGMKAVKDFQELVWIMLQGKDKFALTSMNATQIMEIVFPIPYVSIARVPLNVVSVSEDLLVIKK